MKYRFYCFPSCLPCTIMAQGLLVGRDPAYPTLGDGTLAGQKEYSGYRALEINARGGRLLTNLRNLVSATVEIKVPDRNRLGVEVC